MNDLPPWASAHLPTAIFVGSFLFGETVILAATVLAAQGAVSVRALYVMALLGTLGSDLVWFFFGQRLVALAHNWRRVRHRLAVYLARLRARDDEGHGYHYLLFYKFVYGIRIATIVYTSLRRISWRRFLLLNTLGAVVWLAVLVGAGLLLCRGAASVAPSAHVLRYALAAPVLLFILLRVGAQWLRKRLFAV